MSQVVDSLDAAHDAAARHAWREAYAAYEGADSASLTAEDLELYGEAAWWQGKLDAAIGLRERACAAYAAAADKIGAARLALTLSWDHEGRGEFARTGADGTDFGGQDVHVAARIGAVAAAAEILVSSETLDGVGTAFRLSAPREETLRGIAQPVELVSVDWR